MKVLCKLTDEEKNMYMGIEDKYSALYALLLSIKGTDLEAKYIDKIVEDKRSAEQEKTHFWDTICSKYIFCIEEEKQIHINYLTNELYIE